MVENISHSKIEFNRQDLSTAGFGEIIIGFDERHSEILGRCKTCDEDDEALTQIECDDLRFRYFSVAVEKATTRDQYLEIYERTVDCPNHAYIRTLVEERMATLPISVRNP